MDEHGGRERQTKAEQSEAEQTRADQSGPEQTRADQSGPERTPERTLEQRTSRRRLGEVPRRDRPERGGWWLISFPCVIFI